MQVCWRKFLLVFLQFSFGLLYYQALETDKIQTLKLKKDNFDKKIIISSAGKDDIYWWPDNISAAFNVVWKGNGELALITDASKSGWCTDLEVTNRSFTLEEIELHINVLELKTIYFGLQGLCDNIRRDTLRKF